MLVAALMLLAQAATVKPSPPVAFQTILNSACGASSGLLRIAGSLSSPASLSTSRASSCRSVTRRRSLPSRAITLSFASANGGRRIDWSITNGPSTLDLLVNHGLEVNVERDLDPAVDSMNTDGTIAVTCSIANVLGDVRPIVRTTDRVSEWLSRPARRAA